MLLRRLLLPHRQLTLLRDATARTLAALDLMTTRSNDSEGQAYCILWADHAVRLIMPQGDL
jgi:hypothetical protein